MTAPTADDNLLDRVLTGDAHAFRLLVERYDRMVTALLIDRIGRREEVQDLRQEVFFRIYKGLDSLRDRAKFNSWVRGICRNVVREYFAARSRRPGGLDDLPEPAEEPGDDVAESIEFAIRKALDLLPARYREVLRLRYFVKMRYEDIARTLGLSFMAVDALMRRAKGRLKEVVTPILERERLK